MARPVRETAADRFWRKVTKAEECWIWKACRDKDGYGVFQLNGKAVKAHRLSFELAKGPILDDMCVCHSCDNPSCVNPAHLWLGTTAENTHDMLQKGRNNPNRGEQHWGSRLTEAQVQEIRQLYATGEFLQIDLGHRFGVSHTAISRIINAKRWKGDPVGAHSSDEPIWEYIRAES